MKFFGDSKIIWSYLKKYKKRVYLTALTALVASFIAAIIPYIYGRLVDIIITDSFELKIVVLILLLWLFLSLIGDWINRFYINKGNRIGIDIYNDFLLTIINHIIHLPLSFHKDKKMGEVIQSVERGANHFINIVSQVVFRIAPSFLTVIIALMIMSFIEWRLTIFLSLILAAYSLVSVIKVRPIEETQKKLNKAYEAVYGNLYDSVLNIQIVKAFTNEGFEKKKIKDGFQDKAGKTYKSFIDSWRSLNAWQQTIFSLGFVFIFTMAIWDLKQEIITTGQFVMFIGYISLAYRPFGQLAENYKIIKIGLTTIHRASNFLKIEQEPCLEYKEKIENIKGKVEFINVSFGYSNKEKVLKNICFSAKAGEVVALVGESGGGKTTLVDLLFRYYKPQEGKILMDGCDVADISLSFLRRNVAVVPQEPALFNDTIWNNIRYGKLDATKEEVVSAAKAACAHKFIQKFPKKYKQLVGERGIKLSAGQKQRIAIARAILKDPKILILDEATSSLDSITERLVQKALTRLIKGRTTFIIAHRLSTIQRADKILVLEDGKVIEEGNHQELISNGEVYKKLSELQSTVIK